MTYQTRKIISNILLFLETLFLFLIIILSVVKITLNEKNIIEKMDKSNYYEKLYNETIENMQYITRKSGFTSKIVDDTFNIEDIKRDTNKYVENIFRNKPIEINIETLKENIEINLENNIEENNLEIDSSIKKEYINKITTTYKNEIRLMKEYNNISKDLIHKENFIKTLLILSIIDLIILVIINKKIFNKKEYYIICFTNAIALIITNIIIRIYLKKLFIYNNSLTDVFKLVVKKGIHINSIIWVILIILGTITYKYIKEEKEEIYE